METAVIWCKFLMSHSSKFIHSLEMVFAQLMHTPADPNSLRDNTPAKRSLVDGHDDANNLRVWPLSFCIFFVKWKGHWFVICSLLASERCLATTWAPDKVANLRLTHLSPVDGSAVDSHFLWEWKTRLQTLQGLCINHSCLLPSIIAIRLHLSSYHQTSAYRVSS